MKSKEVDMYIERYEGERKRVMKKLRKLILKTFPKIKEEMFYGVPWYDGKFYLAVMKDGVNMGFSIKGLPKKKADELEGKGEYMRHLKFKTVKDVDDAKEKIVRIMKVTPRHVYAHNKK